MSYTTITPEDAAKYPEFAGRSGKSIEASEYNSVKRSHGDLQTTAEAVAEKKKEPVVPAPASAARGSRTPEQVRADRNAKARARRAAAKKSPAKGGKKRK